MADESIIEKIRKCWALAEHPNTPPHEKELALTRAHELMARHSIDLAVIQEKQGKREAVILKHIRITEDGRKVTVKDQRIFLAAVVGRHNRCRCVIQYKYETADVETGQRLPGGTFFTVVGFETDVMFVEQLYWQLTFTMMEEMMDEAVQTENYRKNFCDGFVNRIDDRLRENNRRVEQEVAPQGSSTALVLVSRQEMVKAEFDTMFPPQSLGKQVVSKFKYDPNARARGAKAAERADIGNKKIGDNRKAIGEG